MLYVRVLAVFTALVAVFALFSLYVTQSEKPSITSKSRFLEVLDKDDNVVGYLVGSMHLNLEREELEPTVKVLEGLLPNIKHLFLECITGHWTSMGEGAEKSLLRTVEKSYENIEVKQLETIATQRAMLGATFNLVGYNGRLSYGSMFIHYPGVCSIISGWNRLIWYVPNTVYQTLINPEFASQNAVKINKALKGYRKSFLSNQTGGEYPQEEPVLFQIEIRDEYMYKKLVESAGEFSKDNRFLVMIGMMHLSVDSGIISHFENNGYTVRPMDLS